LGPSTAKITRSTGVQDVAKIVCSTDALLLTPNFLPIPSVVRVTEHRLHLRGKVGEEAVDEPLLVRAIDMIECWVIDPVACDYDDGIRDHGPGSPQHANQGVFN
jgi:hypothetical protein